MAMIGPFVWSGPLDPTMRLSRAGADAPQPLADPQRPDPWARYTAPKLESVRADIQHQLDRAGELIAQIRERIASSNRNDWAAVEALTGQLGQVIADLKMATPINVNSVEAGDFWWNNKMQAISSF